LSKPSHVLLTRGSLIDADHHQKMAAPKAKIAVVMLNRTTIVVLSASPHLIDGTLERGFGPSGDHVKIGFQHRYIAVYFVFAH